MYETTPAQIIKILSMMVKFVAMQTQRIQQEKEQM
jgi:hypothetical protein